MFNKEKEINKSELFTCPWNQDNGYVIDYTFATRLFSFLLRNYQSMASAHPMDEEEFEYLIRSAATLKKWQMSVPTKLNNQYFSNLKGQKIEAHKIKYLNAIGCPNVIDVEKYINQEVEDKDKSCSLRDGIWIAVNPDGKYRAFIGCPHRKKEKEMVTDYDNEEEDYHGHFFHPEKWSGNYVEYWQGYYKIDYDTGTIVNSLDLPAKFQGMTWEDNPKLLL